MIGRAPHRARRRRRVRAGVLAGLCALAVAAVPAAARAAAAGCRARAEVRPATAVVGQQLLYRVRIEQDAHVARVDWLSPPRFPDFRAEWLPGAVEHAPADDANGGRAVHTERRAIFPQRAGSLVIPPASITCGRARGAGRGDGHGVVELPAIRVQVARVPVEGRPEGWAGLVGPVLVQLAHVPDRIALGETLDVSISVRGAANVWDGELPLDVAALEQGSPRVEVFPRDPELSLERGDRLHARLFHRLSLVPRETGRLRLRTRSLVYFDPSTGGYARVPAAARDVEIVARGATRDGRATAGTGARDAGAPASEGGGPAPASTADGGRGGLVWALALAGAVLLAGLLAGPLFLRRCQEVRDERRAWHEAEAAATAGDHRREAAALERALRSVLARHHPELAHLESGALQRHAAGEPWLQGVARALAQLERARYAGTSARADRTAIRALLSRDSRTT